MGDLNSRFGQPPLFDEQMSYKANPDKIINANGRSLIRILNEEKSFHLVNGLETKSLHCDSTFTFFLGDVSSQNDISLTNNTDLISEFKILERNIYSDHKPISITLSAKPKASLELS